jgi:Mn-dependent DtxR family transcriptional regulator
MQPPFTPRQGQYLAFIYYYDKLNRRPPAEADIQRYFNVSPPSVHQMVLALEAAGHVERTPRKGRSIRVLVSAAQLSPLE